MVEHPSDDALFDRARRAVRGDGAGVRAARLDLRRLRGASRARGPARARPRRRRGASLPAPGAGRFDRPGAEASTRRRARSPRPAAVAAALVIVPRKAPMGGGEQPHPRCRLRRRPRAGGVHPARAPPRALRRVPRAGPARPVRFIPRREDPMITRPHLPVLAAFAASLLASSCATPATDSPTLRGWSLVGRGRRRVTG